MRSILVFLAFLVLCAPSFAQKGGGTTDGGIDQGLEVTVSVTDRVRGLRYSASLPGQQATFAVTCVASGAPAGYSYHYGWSGTGVTFDDPHAASTTARVNGAMKTSVVCDVSAYPGTNNSVQVVGNDGETIAAIGGPLTPSIASAGQWSTPTRDADAGAGGRSWYLQYFGFDPSGPTPTGSEPPQLGRLSAPTQITPGTSYSWSTIGNGTFVGSSTGSSVVIGATNQSGVATIGAHCTFSYTDPTDMSLYGSAQDDSDETPPPGTTAADSSYYRFTGHRPSDILNVSKTTLSTTNGPTTFSITDGYLMNVKDHLGLLAGGVWVQERFPNGEVAGTNQAFGKFWITNSVGQLCDGDGSHPLAYDALGYSDTNSYAYPANQVPAQTRVQKYYGGTKSWVLTNVGVYLRTYRCYFWTNYTEHNVAPDTL